MHIGQRVEYAFDKDRFQEKIEVMFQLNGPCIYKLFNAGILVYVGSTVNFYSRLASLLYEKRISFTHYSVEPVPYESLQLEEQALLNSMTELPKFNRSRWAHRPRKSRLMAKKV